MSVKREIKKIIEGVTIQNVIGSTNALVDHLTMDSRKARTGSLFFAIKGTQTNGHHFINQAIANGCRAIIAEQDIEVAKDVTIIMVDNSARAMGIIAHNFYEKPSEKLALVGVTGTNGKTTIATLLYQLFMQLGYRSGLLSTVVNKIVDTEIPSTHTTPDAISLNALLAKMVDTCSYCFMEVSSHAIAQDRIAGLTFRGGIFTNITHDHLDYHETFKIYRDVKKQFFDNLPKKAFALVNLDDKNGSVMVQNTSASVFSYALKRPTDYKAKVIENQFQGMLLNIEDVEFWTPLVGEFNAYNLLAVYATARLLGEERTELLPALSALQPVDGRFDYFVSESGVIVVVDYAHTPDALQNVLKTINQMRTNNETLYTIVGCGGDRDKTKRPEMAKIACQYSNKVILTSDNPRNEQPETILEEMQKGVPGHFYNKILSIADRKQAIKTAIMMSTKNDIILIAGKGHETYQEIKGIKYDFDDKKIARELFREFEQKLD